MESHLCGNIRRCLTEYPRRNVVLAKRASGTRNPDSTLVNNSYRCRRSGLRE